MTTELYDTEKDSTDLPYIGELFPFSRTNVNKVSAVLYTFHTGIGLNTASSSNEMKGYNQVVSIASYHVDSKMSTLKIPPPKKE